MAIAVLTIDIEARLARLEEGLSQVGRINQKAARDVESRWQTAGTAVKSALAPLAAFFTADFLKNFVIGNAKAVESLIDISAATGSTVENISALQDVARNAGKDIAVAETALIRLNRALGEAKPDSDASRAFTALGLSVEKLKLLDPAEALRQTAVALRGFADDGNKARLVMELTGKSIAEVGPFLKDLAEQGQLNASVTKEQADKAEQFVRALGQYETAAVAARRSLTVQLLPVLTDFIERINAAVAAHGGFIAALKAQNPIEAPPVNAIEGLARYRAELERMQEAVAKVGSVRGGTPLADKLQIDANAAKARIPEIKQFIDYYERLLKLTDKAGAGRGSVNPADVRPSVGDPNADAAAAKETAKRLKSLADDARREQEFLGKQFAEGQEEEAKIATEAWTAVADQRNKELAAADQAQIDSLKKSIDTFQAFTADILKNDRTKEVTEKMSEFAKQAARNIQDALGTTLKNTLRGDFKSIGELWRNLLIDMAAEAAALQLNQFLFGKDKENPFTGGAIGAGLKWLGAFDVGTPFVPQTGLALVHRGERIVPANQNRGGGGITFNQTVNVGNGVSRNDVALAMNIARQQTKADIADAMRRGSPVFS